MGIIEEIQVEMKNSVDLQNKLYDDIVLPALGEITMNQLIRNIWKNYMVLTHKLLRNA